MSDPAASPGRSAAFGEIAFVGLGQMGLPMACNLLRAGFQVRGSDAVAPARDAFVQAGGRACATPAEAADSAAVLIAMLPDGSVVREVLLGAGRAAHALAPGGLVVDMSSSSPFGTRRLGAELADMGLRLVDAPVSGGVAKAAAGTLSIMAGGAAADLEAVQPLLLAMGKTVFPTGPLGSGHAMKALNNYVSAAGLTAACEALLVGEAFGLKPEVIVDILNASTGRNNATDVKLKPFVLSGSYASGFSMALMAKDIRTAAELAAQLGQAAAGLDAATALWDRASRRLGPDADHTAVHAFLADPT